MAEYITSDELDAIIACIDRVRESQHVAEIAALKAENKILEATGAKLQYKNTALSLYVKYGLTKEDEIDDRTGEILKGVRKENGNKENNQDENEEGSSS